MSLFDYQVSRRIEAEDHPFCATIMAAIRRADTDNTRKLIAAFPGIYDELLRRYNAPGGRLPEDTPERQWDEEAYNT